MLNIQNVSQGVLGPTLGKSWGFFFALWLLAIRLGPPVSLGGLQVTEKPMDLICNCREHAAAEGPRIGLKLAKMSLSAEPSNIEHSKCITRSQKVLWGQH